MAKNFIVNLYNKHYKKILFIPVIILILAFIQIGAQISLTGDFVNKGVSLKGGSTITITKDINPIELQKYLAENFKGADISVRTLTQAGQSVAVTIDSDAQTEEEIDAVITAIKKKFSISHDDYTTEIIGSSLGRSFFRQTLIAVIIAFFLMGLVVFIYFRTPIPSLAVILCALSDIIIALAIFNLLGFKLSTAGIAAFLMLIGYSVDTDILLTTRVIKRKEDTLMTRMLGALKTGLTMTLTTLIAIIVALIFVGSPVIKQIMTILLIGLVVDIMCTWFQNAGILRWYMEKKTKKHESSENI